MLTENTVTKLQEMKLTAMARAFKANADLIIGSTWRFFATTP